MTAVAAAAIGGDWRDLAAGAFRDATRPQIRGTVLFGLGALLFTALINPTPFVQFLRALPWHLFLLGSVLQFQLMAFVLLGAILVANRAVDAGAPRRRAYVAAALGGCVLGVLLAEAFDVAWRTWVLPDTWPAHRPYVRSAYYRATYALTSWLLLGAPAVFFYADRRSARKTAAYLQSAELDRIRRSRLALESRLQAMQARVEPQFLFNTLAQVERLYEEQPQLAERMLDDLIAYLRAAMPLMRDTASTVGQEVELARTYLDIVKIRLGDRLAFEIDVPEGVDGARMPPMMLLPLVDHAIVHGLEQRRDHGTLVIAIDVAATRLRLRIADSGAGFVPETGGDGIADIRERLAALYGGDAQLALRSRGACATEAVMEIPLEYAQPNLPVM
jgi:histidine kinase